MKALLFSKVLTFLICCMILCLACHRDQVQQFNVDLLYGDGTKENYAMVEGGMLLVQEGDMNVITKVVSGNKDALDLEVTRYTVTYDSIKSAHTIKKSGMSTQKISMTHQAQLDPSGSAQLTPQSMAMATAGGSGTKGKCRAICCEAKCYSTWCCIDPDECKDVPCDCKPPASCNVTHTALEASHFFEMYRSGKDVMVVN